MDRRTLLYNMFSAMSVELGASHWWPGETPFEVAVGAILTQNTAWTNVEKALAVLRSHGALEPATMDTMPETDLAEAIRSSGYFRLKATRLKAFVEFLRTESALSSPQLSMLHSQPTDVLRHKLLAVKGIGPETADSILLYALERPVFVVDAYTARILHRHMLLGEEAGYHDIQTFFMEQLEADTRLFNEYHALIVRVGKEWCHKRAAKCHTCPLAPFLE